MDQKLFCRCEGGREARPGSLFVSAKRKNADEEGTVLVQSSIDRGPDSASETTNRAELQIVATGGPTAS